MPELRLGAGWQAASCAPDAHADPGSIDGLDWLPASVPGTAAAALREAGRWSPGEPVDLDAEDWWFRTRFDSEPAGEGERVVLSLGGIATVAEVFLNGERVLRSESMYHSHEIEVGDRLRAGGNELAIRCLALAPLIEAPRRPRARWRTKLAANGLRFQRTMLLGRMPGPAPGPQAVGPWRPVSLKRGGGATIERLRLRPRLEGEEGVLEVGAGLLPPAGEQVTAVSVALSGPSGDHGANLELRSARGGVEVAGELRVPAAARWWPHTHGEPALHDVSLRIESEGGAVEVEAGRIGFRELAAGPDRNHDVERLGLDLHLNGTRVFARGAVWTPADPVGLAPDEEALRAQLEQARDAGMNMMRLAGTGAYESAAFHDLCDELGIMVWQDFMFANMDYPLADEGFRESVEREAREALGTVGGRPSLTVLCGNSEVEQQVAMLGLDPALGRGELFGELLPELAREAAPEVPYLPSAPCGGELPFRADAGVANYFGVGGYRRPLSDARRAGVRFASECLAIANLADGDGIETPAISDAGVDWDFGDVRDHYLGLLHDVDPRVLREEDPERYLALSREVSGEVMAAVFGEWRRGGSPCGGGLVLWLRDLEPGAGWGILDAAGRPKAAHGHLRRALAPRAVWMTDEGINGVGVHVANDSPEPLRGRLRVSLYRDFEQLAGEAEEEIDLGPHETASRDVEGILGRFADLSWSFRFGPPAQDAIAAAVELDDPAQAIPPAVHFPVGAPGAAQTPEELGLEASTEPVAGGSHALLLRSRRLVHGLRVQAPGLVAADDAFSLEPARERRLAMRPEPGADSGSPPTITLTAVNMQGRLTVPRSSPIARP